MLSSTIFVVLPSGSGEGLLEVGKLAAPGTRIMTEKGAGRSGTGVIGFAVSPVMVVMANYFRQHSRRWLQLKSK